MGCGSCGSGGCSSGGCGRNGGCATGGCNKLNTYDWLGNMLGPDTTEVNNVYEVRFKNTRKSFYRNANGLRLYIGDSVVVESDRGYDVGVLSLGGVLTRLQMKKKNVKAKPEQLPKIYRKANERDLELLETVRGRDTETRMRTREIITDLKLDMKLSDVEFQGDNAKAIFYYIADHRVDFRELIKILAREFRIRVEMKQIGLRHEAGLVGGIGSCGRELCCSTWLTEFKTVSTSAARYQNLSLNPMKISGLCGRLKCCLNFELEVYMDALQDFPKTETLETEKGRAYLQKTDIFKGKMWFSYPSETTWYPLDTEEVKRIVELNKAGEKPEALAALQPAADEVELEAEMDFVDVVGKHKPPAEPRNRRKKRNTSNNRNRNNRQNRNSPKNSKTANNQTQKKQQGNDGPKSEDSQEKKEGGEKRSGRGPGRGNQQNRRRGNNRRRGPQNNKGPQNNDSKKDSGPKTD